MEKSFTTLTIQNIYILDHHAVRITIEKNYVVFHINPKNLIQPDKKEELIAFLDLLVILIYLAV